MLKEYYSITELAEKTQIAESTARRYIANFPDFFMVQGGARSRRLESTAIKVLLRIKQLFDNGYETSQVDATLRNEFPMFVEGNKPEESEKKAPALATAEDMQEVKEVLKQQQEFNKLLMQKLEQQERYIKDSLESRDKQLMEALNTMQEERKALTEPAASKEPEEKPSFFKKWFGNKT